MGARGVCWVPGECAGCRLGMMGAGRVPTVGAAPQLYDMTDTFLRFLPGPHRRIPRLLAKLRSFVAQRVQHNARTLRPEHPRDFIDRFLLQMEKVGGQHPEGGPGTPEGGGAP